MSCRAHRTTVLVTRRQCAPRGSYDQYECHAADHRVGMDTKRGRWRSMLIGVRRHVRRLAPRTVRATLTASFGVVVVLLIAVVTVGVTAVRSLGHAHAHVASGVLPAIEAADATRSSAGDMHFSQ